MQPPASQAEEPSRLGLQLSLRGKLTAAFSIFFVLIAALTLLAFLWGVPFTPYGGRLQRELQDAENSLSLVADLKKGTSLGLAAAMPPGPALLGQEPVRHQ